MPQIIHIGPLDVRVRNASGDPLIGIFPVPHTPCHDHQACRIKGIIAGRKGQQLVAVGHIHIGDAQRPALYLIDIVIEFLLTRKVNGVPIFEPGICGILGVCNKVAEDLVLIGLIIGIQLDDRVFIVIYFSVPNIDRSRIL